RRSGLLCDCHRHPGSRRARSRRGRRSTVVRRGPPHPLGCATMTPAELAVLIRGLAVDVFTEHDLDPSVLPDEVVVERPRNPEHGDYATNVAMQAAGRAGAKPRDVAGWLVDKLAEADG